MLAGETAEIQTLRSINIIFDMETGDPDDVLTLLLLASHPNVSLRADAWSPFFGLEVGDQCTA